MRIVKIVLRYTSVCLPWAIFSASVLWCLAFDLRTAEHRSHDLTVGLPPITTAELFVVNRWSDEKVLPGSGFSLASGSAEWSVESHVLVTGKDAEELAQIWRTRIFSGEGAGCHNPVYGLRFRSGHRVVLNASICWECSNCLVTDSSGTINQVGMADLDRALANDPEARLDYALLRRLRTLLPPLPPTRAAIALMIGKHEIFCKNYPAAIRELDEAMQLKPDRPDIYSARALYFEKTDQLPHAVAELDRGISLVKDWSGMIWSKDLAFEQRARLLFKSDRITEALHDATIALNESGYSKSAQLLQLRANIYDKLGRSKEAEEDRRAANPR